MSKCPTKRPDTAKVPSSLVDTYIQYKKDTTAVITWLISHGTTNYQQLSALSLKELVSLADIVKMKAVEMPTTIRFQFREAIAARTQLSQWYRKLNKDLGNEDGDGDQVTCDHEHFTIW